MAAKGSSLRCTAALVGTAAAGAALSAPFAWREGLWAGWAAALALALPSYWSLAWALQRSDKVFFSTYVAGALFRLAGLALTAWIAWTAGRPPLPPVMVAAAGGLLLLSLVEAYFIQKETRP